jgi:hypothetical protein
MGPNEIFAAELTGYRGLSQHSTTLALATLCRSDRAGRILNIQDPGLRFASPWAAVYHAFGVLLRSDLLKLP